MKSCVIVVLLQFIALSLPAQVTNDTTGVMRALASILQTELQPPITVQLDTATCNWSAPSCSTGAMSGVSQHPLVDALVVALGDKGRRWESGVADCRAYGRGPFDIVVRPPVFDSGGARILVSMNCLRLAYSRGEEFAFRFDGAWHLTARRLVWVT